MKDKEHRVKRLVEVSVNDLRAVTDAINANWKEQHESGGGHLYCLCQFCSQEQDVKWKTVGCEVIREYHDKDYPVLIARSIEPDAGGEGRESRAGRNA